MAFKVAATSLNLRSEPRVHPATRLATLPHGHIVSKLEETAGGWWRVSTNIEGARLTGFVAGRYLVDDQTAEPHATGGLVPVHLQEDRVAVRRIATSGRAFPLGEGGRPTRSAASPEERVRQLHDIVSYLDVERYARYRPGAGATYCNIYAFDYCYLAGVYLPRVWWTSSALADLRAGRSVPIKYDETVREMNANALYDWLREFGLEFGWQRESDVDALQQNANRGGVSVICAQRKDLNRSGHICVVVPEQPPQEAQRQRGNVHLPLQSQAGSRNFCYSCGTSAWWARAQFRTFGFWCHE